MTTYTKNSLRIIDDMIGNEGKKIALSYNGQIIYRRVYFSKSCGLYIRINNKMIFAYDFYKSDTIELDELGLPIEE